jgi:hypothetical protein
MLAARMTAIIPDGFRVEATDGMLWYSVQGGRLPGQSGNYQKLGRSGTDLRANLDGRRADDDALARIAARALDDLQDYVDEATHEPWPAQRGTPPRPYAQVRDQMLYLWYGGPDLNEAAVLSCEPIPLADPNPA